MSKLNERIEDVYRMVNYAIHFTARSYLGANPMVLDLMQARTILELLEDIRVLRRRG